MTLTVHHDVLVPPELILVTMIRAGAKLAAATIASSVAKENSMARRKYQKPEPVMHGRWWTIRPYMTDDDSAKRPRVKLAPIGTAMKEVQRLADEHMRPINAVLAGNGGTTKTLKTFVKETYEPCQMPLLASTTQPRYRTDIKKYLLPIFGDRPLHSLTRKSLQAFFSTIKQDARTAHLSHESHKKIRNILSAILRSAVDYELLLKNPMEGVKLPPNKKPKLPKHYVTPAQFDELLSHIPEPYASAIYVDVHTGLRPSELTALRFADLGAASIRVDERFCRGDWAGPKTVASNATIDVDQEVIERLQALKDLSVTVRAGLGKRTYKVVKSAKPDDLVFQSLADATKPLNYNNVLRRHIKPAACKIGLPWINWRCLRTSRATWLNQAGVSLNEIQVQMRHASASTTANCYVQSTPEGQKQAVKATHEWVAKQTADARGCKSACSSGRGIHQLIWTQLAEWTQ